MSAVIHAVLSTELTVIPSSLQRTFGNSFNNTICNGVTWLFSIWLLIYFCYDKMIHAYLKHLGFTQYLRIRMSLSLWLLAFFSAYTAYYLLTTNDINIADLISFKRNIITQYENVSTHRILAQVILCSFCIHMSYSQGVQLGSLHTFSKFIAFTVVCTSAYILRYLDLPFTLTALVAISGIVEELSKMFYSLLSKENKLCVMFNSSFFISSVLLFSTVYFLIIPLSFLIPLGMKVFSPNTDCLLFILFFSLLLWFNLAIYKSIVLNLFFHWLYHLKKTNEDEDEDEKQKIKFGCFGNIIECSLFPPRTDDGYMIAVLRYEAKKRERRMIAKRKPKNRNMIIQALKCMMTIKKKLSEKRAENASGDDSDSEDDKSEEVYLENCDHGDKDNDEDDNNEMQEELIKMKRSDKIFKFSTETVGNLLENANGEKNRDESETELKITELEEEVDSANHEDALKTLEDAKETFEAKANVPTQGKEEPYKTDKEQEDVACRSTLKNTNTAETTAISCDTSSGQATKTNQSSNDNCEVQSACQAFNRPLVDRNTNENTEIHCRCQAFVDTHEKIKKNHQENCHQKSELGNVAKGNGNGKAME